MQKTKKEKNDLITCPKCGSSVKWYHNVGVSRAVCQKKCEGFKVIKTVYR